MAVGDVTADGRARVLADGHLMPILGLGVWQVPDGPACVNAVRWALDLGYRHIDTAQVYGNEASVGRALREAGLPRDEVFITTKFHPGRADPVAEAEQSLRRLGVQLQRERRCYPPGRAARRPASGPDTRAGAAALVRPATDRAQERDVWHGGLRRLLAIMPTRPAS
jgi:hypothetical protein